MEWLIQFLADGLVIPLVLIGAIAVLRLPRAQRQQTIVRGTLMALTALWFAKVASLLYQGTRPFEQLGVAPGASFLPNPGFPSDHALLVFVVVAVVYAGTKLHALSVMLLAAALLVATGRVLALVHSLADVVGSLVCVLLAAVLWYGPSLKQKFVNTKQPLNFHSSD